MLSSSGTGRASQPRVGLRELRPKASAHLRQFTCRAFEGHARLQPGDRFDEVCRAAVTGQVPIQAQPQVHIVRERELRGHDADDRVLAGIDVQRLADDRRVGVVAVRQSRSLITAIRSRECNGLLRETGTELRRHAEQLEEVAAGFDRAYANRLEPGLREVHLGPPPRRCVRERGRRVAVIHEIDRRQSLLRQRLSALVSHIVTSCSGSRNGSGRSSTVSTMLKMAVAAPAPRPSVRMATAANEGERRHWRQAKRRSPPTPSDAAPSDISLFGRASGRRVTAAARPRVGIRRARLPRGRRIGVGSAGPTASEYISSRCAASSSTVWGGKSAPVSSRVATTTFQSICRHVQLPGFYAYLTPATWPSAAMNRLQSSRCSARTLRPVSVIR